ncbi:TetR/AcrR family transcriptional regulator [Paraliobacillus sp. JSM ZJ581]|uniref:TetR/AcrR family transcriptional regulator n=1 Tax=Paraliobacillus sp. JSM ZJ581 TaxID=3342118 RepID=UPI0035A8D1BC
MTNKKKKMMYAAMKLFSEKGYHATSMQEIATDAGVSKGLLYKYFDSKEALLIDVFKCNHNNMVERAKYIHFDTTIASTEKLEKMIEIEFEGIVKNKDYFNLLTKSLLIEKNKQVQPFLMQVRAEMLGWHREMLLQVYGDEILPSIWDMVMALQGMLKEYVGFMIQEKQMLKSDQVAKLIVQNMDAIIAAGKGKEPVITQNHMQHYVLYSKQEPLTIQEQLNQMLRKLKNQVKEKKQEVVDYEEILDAIQLFEQELEQDKSRIFLLKALFSFLNQHVSAKDDVVVFEKLLNELN